MGLINLNRPYDYVGDNPRDSHWMRQNGVTFMWSESNIAYEIAWWIDPKVRESELVQSIIKRHPTPAHSDWKTVPRMPPLVRGSDAR